MKDERISGIGSIREGAYESIHVEGMASFKGNISAESVFVEGTLKSKGSLETKKLSVEGVHRAFNDIRAKEVVIEGVLKLRGASLFTESVSCQGLLTCNREISADRFEVFGICSISRLVGDRISIKYYPRRPGAFKGTFEAEALAKPYFGRAVSHKHCYVDEVECTSLEATATVFKRISAQEVDLKDHCIVDELHCDGLIKIDKTCQVKKIIPGSRATIVREENLMGEADILEQVLELYKKDHLTLEEAKKMLAASDIHLKSDLGKETDLLWADDGKLRIVAYLGHRLLEKSDPGVRNLEITYKGDAVDVVSYGNLTCGDIKGNATAGSSAHCENIDGNVTAGSSVHCENIDGNVTAGSSVTCQDVNGKIVAEGGVHIVK